MDGWKEGGEGVMLFPFFRCHLSCSVVIAERMFTWKLLLLLSPISG